MKTQILLYVIVIISLVSCTAANSNEAADAGAAATEKKLTPPAKTKAKTKTAKKNTGGRKIVKPGLSGRAEAAVDYAAKNGLSTKYCFLIDMSLPGGRKRFFVYDLEERSVAWSGLVAHGSCYQGYLSHPRFSNTAESGCSSAGKYKVGAFYHGKFGASYKLYGLDRTNSNAFKRGVVIHGHECVPDDEVYPQAMCNSFGCPMVSFNFFDRLSGIIDASDKPILLWIYQ